MTNYLTKNEQVKYDQLYDQLPVYMTNYLTKNEQIEYDQLYDQFALPT